MNLSARAAAWLDRVGMDRHSHPAPPGDFEARYGGLVIDPNGINLELGVGRLIARGIKPEVVDGKTLIGTEADRDVWIDAGGRLWQSGPDRVLGEYATTVEKLIERLAATVPSDWLAISTGPVGPDLVKALDLAIDSEVTDATFLRASSERHVVLATLRGTPWLMDRATIRCRDFDALFDAMKRTHGMPKGRRQLAMGHDNDVLSLAVWRAMAGPKQAVPKKMNKVGEMASLAPFGAACWNYVSAHPDEKEIKGAMPWLDSWTLETVVGVAFQRSMM